MRHSGSPSIRAVEIWDVLVTAITTVGSIGELLDDYPQLTLYDYGPTSLANNVDFVPPANTVVCNAFILGVVNAIGEWFFWADSTLNRFIDAFTQDIEDDQQSMLGPMMCDGTSGFRNATGAAGNIQLKGWSFA